MSMRSVDMLDRSFSTFPSSPPSSGIGATTHQSFEQEMPSTIPSKNAGRSRSCLQVCWDAICAFVRCLFCCFLSTPSKASDDTKDNPKTSPSSSSLKQSSLSTKNPTPASPSLDDANQQLFDEIHGISSRAQLPQPVDDLLIMNEIYNWTPTQKEEILQGKRKAPSRLHLQAIQYIDAQERSQNSREDEIFSHVFIGNYGSLQATDPRQGNNPRNFTRIISVTRQNPNASNKFYSALIPEAIERRVILVDDEDAAWNDLSFHFEELFQFIDAARLSRENILIHCSQGQSRSVTVLIAYLINRLGVNADDALTYIRTRRFLAEPVPGLKTRLDAYARVILS